MNEPLVLRDFVSQEKLGKIVGKFSVKSFRMNQFSSLACVWTPMIIALPSIP